MKKITLQDIANQLDISKATVSIVLNGHGDKKRVSKETQEKIDVVKQRLINNYGYCEVCATDVLNFVASIFARGDLKGKKE